MDLASRIVLISSGQPSLNPRLVKEADALAEAGYEVIVIYAYWNAWGTEIDKKMLPTKKWKSVRTGGDPQTQKTYYFISKLVHKLANVAYNMGMNSFADLAIARSSWFLKRLALKYKADLYIAHNLGALSAAVNASKKFNKPCGFDAEDFHRHEMSNDVTNREVRLKTYLENKYIPQTNYLTASSAPISNAYKNIFANISPITIRNAFQVREDIKPPEEAATDSLKLVWLSQTVGNGRGLTDIFAAISQLDNNEVELHLLGHLPGGEQQAYISDLLKKYPVNVHFYQPIEPDELAVFASRFDIGLALEPAFSQNNDLALSNKIFIYLQAGLAVVASDTTAQLGFMEQFAGIGKTYDKGNAQSLADILTYYYRNRDELLRAKKNAWALARNRLNWETERSGFLKVVKETLGESD